MTRTLVILGFVLMFLAGTTVGWRARVHAERRMKGNSVVRMDAVMPPATALPTSRPAPAPNDASIPSHHDRGQSGGEGGRGSGGAGGFRGGWLAAELNLTPEQHEQLRQIWSETMRRGRSEGEDPRRQLRSQRDAAIEQLMTAEQRPQYDTILKRYNDQMTELEQQWRASYQTAVDRTRQLLTPEQRDKYEEILARQSWRGSGGPGGPRTPPPPATQPASPD